MYIIVGLEKLPQWAMVLVLCICIAALTEEEMTKGFLLEFGNSYVSLCIGGHIRIQN